MFLTWVPDELIIPAHGKGWNCADFCITSSEGVSTQTKEETHQLIDLKLQEISLSIARPSFPFSYFHLSVLDSPPSLLSILALIFYFHVIIAWCKPSVLHDLRAQPETAYVQVVLQWT